MRNDQLIIKYSKNKVAKPISIKSLLKCDKIDDGVVQCLDGR